jgi:hypothetical protein
MPAGADVKQSLLPACVFPCKKAPEDQGFFCCFWFPPDNSCSGSVGYNRELTPDGATALSAWSQPNADLPAFLKEYTHEVEGGR